MRMEFEPTGDGRVVAIVQDGAETHMAYGATRSEAESRMKETLRRLRMQHGVCKKCGARRDKCCC